MGLYDDLSGLPPPMYLLGGLVLLSKAVPTAVDAPAKDAGSGSTNLCSTTALAGDRDLTS